MHSLLPGIDSLGEILQNDVSRTPPKTHPPGVPLPTKQKPPKMTIFKPETLQKGLFQPTTTGGCQKPPFLTTFDHF